MPRVLSFAAISLALSLSLSCCHLASTLSLSLSLALSLSFSLSRSLSLILPRSLALSLSFSLVIALALCATPPTPAGEGRLRRQDAVRSWHPTHAATAIGPAALAVGEAAILLHSPLLPGAAECTPLIRGCNRVGDGGVSTIKVSPTAQAAKALVKDDLERGALGERAQ